MRIVIKYLVLFIYTFVCYDAAAETNKVSIHVEIRQSETKDTITLYVWDNYVDLGRMCNKVPHREYKKVICNGKFDFIIDSVYKACYIMIGKGHQDGGSIPVKIIMSPNLIEPGDSIFITMELSSRPQSNTMDPFWDPLSYSYNLQFTGKGASKFECYYNIGMRRMEAFVGSPNRPISSFLKENIDINDTIRSFRQIQYIFKIYDSLMEQELAILNFYRPVLSIAAYSIMYGNIYGIYNNMKCYRASLYASGFRAWGDKKSNFLAGLRRFYEQNCMNLPELDIPSVYLAQSPFYIVFLVEKLSRFEKDFPLSYMKYDKDCYNDIRLRYNGIILDQCLLRYFIVMDDLDNMAKKIDDAITTVSDNKIKDLLTSLSKDLLPGNASFNFELEDDKGKIVRMTDFKGKVTLIDFWYVGCGHCAEFYQNVLSKVEQHYQSDSNVVFVTINIDNDRSKWLNCLKQKGLNKHGIYTGPLAVNLYTVGLGSLHPIIDHYNIRAFPHSILFDQRGKLFINDKGLQNVEEIEFNIDKLNASLNFVHM